MAQHPNERVKDRYQTARTALRKMQLSKEEQKQVMFLIQKIESYGFNFFADHYIISEIEELEDMAGIERYDAPEKYLKSA